ncbi:hypothetical protein [Planococcus sp. 107-1]|uniref:hypothetical protein n=1 Tax=Planococcus sp. 107-1 TaxID=2908840 RepID=UPI001F474A92|nr:hypothetical protein [Planococcus sp. 107-1]UJF28161.1 hypothetical protein L0M13_07365 [Planococcus sp. 107-1]
MRHIKNENGYALVMVILLVVVFTTLGMGLLAMNINANKQFNVKEDQVQARHQAEMGVLHYKEEIKRVVESYDFVTYKNKSEQENLMLNGDLLCNKINSIKIIKLSDLNDKNYEVSIVSPCKTATDNQLTVEILSVGKTLSTFKSIKNTFKMSPPTILANQPIKKFPEKPNRPSNYTPKNSNDPLDESGYVEITVPFITKKQEHHFKDHFVISGVKGNAFTVGGGKEDKVLVEKDLYMDGNLYIQNHACILVRGDLIINGDLTSQSNGGEINIIVFGDALILGNENLKSDDHLFVKGDVYLSQNKTKILKYNKGSSGNCKAPDSWYEPLKPIPDINKYRWEVQDSIDPVYL